VNASGFVMTVAWANALPFTEAVMVRIPDSTPSKSQVVTLGVPSSAVRPV
jgi:hypothetical protein